MNAQEIQGHWNQIRGKVKEKWGQLTDDDLRLAEGNVEQLVGRIQQKTGEAKRNVERFLDELAAGDGSRLKEAAAQYGQTAVQYGQAAVQTARQGLEQASDQVREGYQRAGEMVQRRPTESMAIVFGLGFVTGLTIGMLLRSDA
jgi:uncharacterized protein YjbJ (UPF0337 family)